MMTDEEGRLEQESDTIERGIGKAGGLCAVGLSCGG
jgi:hypothetical protein